jgi:hypothetical protein
MPEVLDGLAVRARAMMMLLMSVSYSSKPKPWLCNMLPPKGVSYIHDM